MVRTDQDIQKHNLGSWCKTIRNRSLQRKSQEPRMSEHNQRCNREPCSQERQQARVQQRQEHR